MARMRRRRSHGPPSVRDVQLVLAGYPGWLNRDVLSAADAASLGSVMHQLGAVDDDELWCLYSGATVFAFPSRHEGFGLPVLEAMSQGTAVLASDIPAIREVTGGGARLVAAGDVEAWADALEDLLVDEPARARARGCRKGTGSRLRCDRERHCHPGHLPRAGGALASFRARCGHGQQGLRGPLVTGAPRVPR